MHYEGSKFYLAESDISDALTEINDIITNVNNCISSKPSGYEYSGDLSSFSEEMSSIKTKITDIKDKVSELRTNLCNLDSSFGSVYMSYMSANIDDILDGIDEGNYQITSDQKINDMIYKALLELEATGALDEDMKADYIASKFPDIPKDDNQIVDILFDNPKMVYNTKTKIKHGEKYVDTYYLFDANTGMRYHIDSNCKSRDMIDDIFQSVTDLDNRKLSNSIDYVFISSESSPWNEYWQSTGRPGSQDASGGINEKGEAVVTFYKEWENSSNGYKDTYSSNTYILAHEAGHSYDYSHNNISNSKEWKNAMKQDGNFVSQYAQDSYYQRGNDNSEDYAEAIAYITAYGGDTFEKYCPARAQLLKKEFPELFD